MPGNLEKLPLTELRQMWAETWCTQSNARIGRTMLEKSLLFKQQNNLSKQKKEQLKQLIRQYKRNPKCFDESCTLKPNTKLVRHWKGKQHSVLVKVNGFEYQDRIYTSLSKIANEITGSKWNGYLFFGLKKTS